MLPSSQTKYEYGLSTTNHMVTFISYFRKVTLPLTVFLFLCGNSEKYWEIILSLALFVILLIVDLNRKNSSSFLLLSDFRFFFIPFTGNELHFLGQLAFKSSKRISKQFILLFCQSFIYLFYGLVLTKQHL